MDLVFHVMVARLADWLLLTLAVLMTLDMRSLQEEEVVLVKVDSNARQPRDCTAAIDKTRDFFLSSSYILYEATEQLMQFTKVIVQVPSQWSGRDCQRSSKHRLPPNSVDVLMSDGAETKAFHLEPTCGKRGRYVTLGTEIMQFRGSGGRIARTQKKFVSEWVKYRFGVFDERGYRGSAVHPLFHRRKVGSDSVAVTPTSCLATPLAEREFDVGCLGPAPPANGSCAITDEVAQVSSSLAYGADDLQTFPQMSNFCNDSNHDRVSPTRQNLLCDGASIMNVIRGHSAQVGDSGRAFRAPEVIIVQEKSSSELIIVQDVGPAMTEDRYASLRLGLEHLFATLSPTTVLAIVSSRGDNPVVLPNVTTTLGGADRNEFEDMVFPARLRVGEENRRDLDLSRTFAKVAEMLPLFEHPNILVLTATEEDSSRDLSSVLTLVNDKQLQVDMVTFSGVNFPGLIGLAKYGNLYTISEDGNKFRMASQAASILLEIFSSMEDLNYRQVSFLKMQMPVATQPNTSTTFAVPSSRRTEANQEAGETPKFGIICMVPTFSGMAPVISLTAPDGSVYGNALTSNIGLRRVWSQNVQHLATPPSSVSGEWRISVSASQDGEPESGQMYISVYLDLKASIGIPPPKGLLPASSRVPTGVDASKLFGLEIFAEVSDISDFHYEVKAQVGRLELVDSEGVWLKDNGLAEQKKFHKVCDNGITRNRGSRNSTMVFFTASNSKMPI